MNFLGGSFRIGQLFGINIRVHMLFVIWIGFTLFTAGAGWRSELIFLTMLFGIVFLHEFGHCFGARAVGGYAENILMWPLGGLAYAHAPMRPWPQFVTVAAGPLVNVLFCVLSAAAIFLGTGATLLPGINPLHLGLHVVRELPTFAPVLSDTSFTVLLTFYRVNLFLLAFNLLPIFPMDGGQLFHAVIWPFVGLQRASIIASVVGLAGCAVLGVLGLREGGMLFFIAIFGGFTSWQHLQAARRGLLTEDSRFERFYGPSYDPRPWWQRIFRVGGRRPARPSSPVEFPNPNPGGWAAHEDERRRTDAELDRLLKKVSEHGIHSLSYVERQTLERITRERQREENNYQHGNRV